MNAPITDPEALEWLDKLHQAFLAITKRTGAFQLYGGAPNYHDYLWLKDLPPDAAITALILDRALQATNSRLDRIEIALSRMGQDATVH